MRSETKVIKRTIVKAFILLFVSAAVIYVLPATVNAVFSDFGGGSVTDPFVGSGSPGDPATFNGYSQSGYYSQGSYYRQGSYGSGYSQGSYSSYSQGSYSSYGQGSYSLTGGDDDYSQSAYFTCPNGFRVFQGRSCCPNAYYAIVDTNGSAKGGRVEQCNIPPGTPSTPTPSTPSTVTPSTTSCTVNGTTVPHGSSYTFYTQGTVPYGTLCSSVAYERTCNNGNFTGNNNGFSRCEVGDAPDITGMWIKAEPPVVRYDGNSTISWDGGNAEACTVSGWSLDSTEKSNESGVEISNFQGESIYTFTCTLGPNTKVETTTVKVLPRTQET